ncbi:DUF1131 family protein [Oscillatoria acuminata]|uniref:Uncharacterized protein n=1 Tax=Oscillatoria acuminata PCC 6304 TaxID=56110 RepID=K9TG01_9CYAN|nr:DUF1131 family protein [Oscillatoria acuminata]AFY81076.1 Protein of unknown function (DUF1131) [Oscillatoria acuminata PCC 6304]
MNDSSSSIAQSILEFVRHSVPGYGIRGGFGVAALLMTLTLGYNSDSQTFAGDHPAVANRQAIANYQSPPLRDSGWGEVGVDTPFNRDRIQALFPNYRVESSQISREGMPQPVIEVYDDSILVARMDPQDANNPNLGILRITIYDESIAGPGGVTIGTSYNQTPGSSRFDCFPGEGPTTGYVICRSPESARIQYIYGPINRERVRPMMELPPENVLGNYRLDRLVWLNWQGR